MLNTNLIRRTRSCNKVDITQHEDVVPLKGLTLGIRIAL